MTTPLLNEMAKRWWLLQFRGVAVVAFDSLAFHWPGLTVIGLTFLWAVYSLADGLLVLAAAVVGRSRRPRLWLALVGLAGIASATVGFAMPQTVAHVLVLFYRHIETPELCVRFKWRPKSLACWDNRCAQHHALWDYWPHGRGPARDDLWRQALRAGRCVSLSNGKTGRKSKWHVQRIS